MSKGSNNIDGPSEVKWQTLARPYVTIICPTVEYWLIDGVRSGYTFPNPVESNNVKKEIV